MLQRRWPILMAIVAGSLAGAPPAPASFEGTPGQVAFLPGDNGVEAPLKLWDPAEAAKDPENAAAGITTLVDKTYILPVGESLSLGYPSPPSWSPDGTRVAYVKSIDGTGNSPHHIDHTAIFVYDLRTGGHTQLTHPAATLVDLDTVAPALGHAIADYGPAWISDDELAFIRLAAATDDDALFDQRGTNVWTISGGAETRRTAYRPGDPVALGGTLAAIPGTRDVLVPAVRGTTPRLDRIGPGGGVTPVANGLISDFDVSPDGQRVTYATIGTGGQQIFEGPLAGVAVAQSGMTGTTSRYSNAGEALLYRGREAARGIDGLLEHIVDPDAHGPAPAGGDRVALPWTEPSGVLGSGGIPSRFAFDIQPQTLPVVFLPGFLGSQIDGCGGTLWPKMPFPALTGMTLAPNGTANAGCADAAPTGGLVESVLGSDVYGSTANALRAQFPGGRLTLLGWDWRKAPKETFDRLDAAITAALDRDGPWKQQKAGRVVVYAHSYGGLLARAYLDEPGGSRVARLLTAGTPFWGAPKSLFPLAFGVESPLPSAMDAFISNANMQALVPNLAGLYHLYPSDQLGPWLTVAGVLQDQSGVANFITLLGGNADLFLAALATHRSIDGFSDRHGFVDVAAIAGKGLPTVESADLVIQGQGDLVLRGRLGDGDGTVPAGSAAQLRGGVPLGDPVRIQSTCDISHVPLPGAGAVTDAYMMFLDRGRPPKRLAEGEACPAGGGAYDFASATIGLPQPRLLARAATDAMSLDDAQAADRIDMIEAGSHVLVVVADRRPQRLRLQIAGGTFRYTPAGGGTELVYGPATGTLELAPSAPGQPPQVTLDGTPLVPTNVVPAPPAPPTGPPATPPAATPPTGAGPAAAGTPAAKARLTLVGRPTLRGRRLRLVVRATTAGTLRLRVTRGGRTLGRTDVTLRAAGRRTVTLTLRRTPTGKVRLALTFTPRTGAAISLSASVTPRRP